MAQVTGGHLVTPVHDGRTLYSGIARQSRVARVLVAVQDRGYLPAREAVSPHQDTVMIRIMALTWSLVTESNRRPSPYHKYGPVH